MLASTNWQPSPGGLTRPQKEDLAWLLLERKRRREARLRQRIQAAKAQNKLIPEVVAAFAALHIVDDDGLPITPAAHHQLWLELICDRRIEKLLVIAPPESAKTTWLLSAFTGVYLGFWPEDNIIIAGSAGDVARRRGLALRTMVESERWRETFPGVLPARGMTWEQREWSLAPDGSPKPGRIHPTVSAYGTGGSVTGSRADLLVVDDILDFDNTRTEHQRKLVWEWVHNTLLRRVKSGGLVRAIGTAWTHDDVYARLRKESDWVICHMPLLSPSEEVYAYLTYPDDWPYETLGEAPSQPVEDALEPTRGET